MYEHNFRSIPETSLTSFWQNRSLGQWDVQTWVLVFFNYLQAQWQYISSEVIAFDSEPWKFDLSYKDILAELYSNKFKRLWDKIETNSYIILSPYSFHLIYTNLQFPNTSFIINLPLFINFCFTINSGSYVNIWHLD